MITAVDIEEKRRKGIGRFLPFKSNKIRVEHLYCDKAAVKCITYENYRKAVNWSVIDRFVKAQRNHLLCREDLELPQKGYKRFESFELQKRMAENAALFLLESFSDKDLSVVLIDDTGDRAGLSGYLLDYSDRVTVITQNTELYLDEAAALLSEKGAVLKVTKHSSALSQADIVIACDRLEQSLDTKENAVIFTSRAPAVSQKSAVICRYFFDLPEKYERIRPAFLDPMYFAEALYTTAKAYELGSELFRFCSDDVTIHTRSSLKEFFKTLL